MRRCITFQGFRGSQEKEQPGVAPDFSQENDDCWNDDYETPTDDGKSPGLIVISSSQGSSDAKTSSVSAQSASLPVKQMKAASASSQFYTTIVVKVCVTCRECIGSVASDRRASFIFRKVESALRDRVAFPLPSTVTIKELMKNSYFQGDDAEDEFRKFCVDEEEPLTTAMIDIGTRLYVRRLPPFIF